MSSVRRAVALAGLAWSCLALAGCGENTGEPGGDVPVDLRSPIWEQPGAARSQPLLVDSLVVAAFNDGRLVAFHAADGREVWSHTLVPGAVAPQLSFVEGLVLVNDQRLTAIRAATGEMVWQYGQSTDPRVFESAVLATGGTAYVAKDFRSRALSLATGDTLWEFRPPGDASWEPVALALSGSTLFVGAAERSIGSFANERRVTVTALDRVTGVPRWRDTLVAELPLALFRAGTVSLLAIGGQLIIATPDGRVRARDALTGNALWTVPQEPAAAGYARVTPLAVNASTFLVQRDDGLVEWRRTSDGALTRRRALSGLAPVAGWAVRAAQPTPCGPFSCVLGLGELHLLRAEPSFDRIVRVPDFSLRTAPAVDAAGVAYLGAASSSRGQFLLAVPLR